MEERAQEPVQERVEASAELLAESLPAPTRAAPAGADSLLQESERYAGAIADLAARGFPAHFEIDDTGVHCRACRSRCRSEDVAWLSHTEVASSSGERSSFVCGLRCPICGSRGTATATAEQWERRREPSVRSQTSR